MFTFLSRERYATPAGNRKELAENQSEALSNVVTHAQAHEVQIELFLDSGRARLCVKDDGQGFEPGLIMGSLGMTSMQERTKDLGGVWSIRASRAAARKFTL